MCASENVQPARNTRRVRTCSENNNLREEKNRGYESASGLNDGGDHGGKEDPGVGVYMRTGRLREPIEIEGRHLRREVRQDNVRGDPRQYAQSERAIQEKATAS